jgi:hypothetical protein
MRKPNLLKRWGKTQNNLTEANAQCHVYVLMECLAYPFRREAVQWDKVGNDQYPPQLWKIIFRDEVKPQPETARVNSLISDVM